MTFDQQFLMRRIFFIGEFRRKRVQELMAIRRLQKPDALMFIDPYDLYELTDGEKTLVNRVNEVTVGELDQWLERMDLRNESPALIFQVIVLFLATNFS